jgi:hypothetical protein
MSIDADIKANRDKVQNPVANLKPKQQVQHRIIKQIEGQASIYMKGRLKQYQITCTHLPGFFLSEESMI